MAQKTKRNTHKHNVINAFKLAYDNEFGPQATGNTKHRGFCLTIFKTEEYETFLNTDCRYYIVGKETCPTTGRTHYQAYIYFNNRHYFDAIKKLFPTAHIEKARGTAEQNRKYCSKENNFIEKGTIPKQGKKQLSAEQLKKMTDEEIIDFDPRCWKAYKTAKDLMNYDMDIEDWEKEIKVYYIQGPSGIGKTQKAKQIIRGNKDTYGTKFNVLKHVNNFWAGIGSAKIAIYDDFRDSHMPASEFINFIDYNKHLLNVKGGDRKNEYNLIIITSVQKIEEIYKNLDEEPRQQWMRRIEVINMY